MKANELMIGDWVRGFVPDSNSTIYGIFNEQRVAIIAEPSKAYIELSIDDIQPIPLTPKILRKNGFGNEMSKYLDGDEIEIELNLDDWELEDEDGFLDCCYQKPITYVHELQHALRLCGIDKEIVL